MKYQKPRVPRGKSIKKGQILAEGEGIVGGELALGKNILVAYMLLEGYNFEYFSYSFPQEDQKWELL